MTQSPDSLTTPDAVLDALRANDARPYGRQRTVTAEELAAAAEQFDDVSLNSLALLDLMEAYEYDGERRKAPVVFARILKLWDSSPDGFSDWGRGQVFWRFKWVATALLSTPDVPLEALHRWHTEMRERYEKAGFALQPYYAQRYHLAAHTGTGEADAFDLWATRPRSRLSDCEACEIRARARHHLRAGSDERALQEWRPVLDGVSSCSEEPHLSRAHALLPLLRAGRTDEARSSHLAGYRHARGRSSTASAIGLHLEFCALSGNEPRGLEILAENRGLFDGHGDELSRLGFLTGVQQLLARLAGLGHGEVAVSGPPGTSWTVATLLDHVRGEGDALAARFDARNGTPTVGDRRRERLARQPLLAEPLVLGVRAAATVPAPAGPATGAAAGAAEAGRSGTEPVPADFTDLVLRARELRDSGHPDSDRLWDEVARRVDADGHVHPEDGRLGSVGRLRAEVAERRAHDAVERQDWAAARERLAAVAELFEQAGMPGRALVVRTRALVVDIGEDGAAPVDWAALDAARHAADTMPAGVLAPDDHLVVLQCRAYAAHHELVEALPEDAGSGAEPPAGPLERFTACVGEYRAAAERHGSLRRTASARQFTADLAARRGQVAEAEAELTEVLGLLEGAGLPWLAPRTLGLLGQVLFHKGDAAASAEAFHRALAGATRWADDDFPYEATYAMLGHASSCSDQPGAAVRAFSEAAARFDRAGRTEEAAQARLHLATVLREGERVADAVAVLESVLSDPAAAAGVDERLLAQVRLDLARGLYELEEYRDAAEEYLRLADAVSGWEDQDTHTMAAAEAAVALAAAGRWEAADAARGRALASHERAPRTDQVSAMLREFARLTVAARGADGLAAALERLAEADAVRERAEAAGHPHASWYLRGAAHYERARVLAAADRPEEALAAAEQAIAAYDAAGAEAERPQAEAVRIAAMIEGNALGRPEAARTRLTAAIDRCRRADLPDAAEILASLHDHLGTHGS